MAVVWIILFVAILYLLLRPIVNGALYFPIPREVVREVTQIAKIRPGEKMADLGSGDGRILVAFAKAGAEAHGYEINPLLVVWSRFLIKKFGLEKKAAVHWKSFWLEDISSFEIITIYGYPDIMKKMGDKLNKELKSGASVISLVYQFPDWEPVGIKKSGKYSIYFYIKA